MRSSQESHIHERLEQRVAQDAVKAPQPLDLVPGQMQAGNFEVLRTYQVNPIGDGRLRSNHLVLT
jgi:hypothetical protein